MDLLQKYPELRFFFSDLSKSKQPILLLDYDGTLAPFRTIREEAFPYPGVKERLQRILTKKVTKIVILSGRKVEELIPLLSLSPLPELWGCHGWEQISEGKHIEYSLYPNMKDGLQKAYHQSASYANLIEQKGFSIALHWRGLDPHLIPKLNEEVQKIWVEIAKHHNLEILPFNGGIELRPIGRNKGKVALEILQKYPNRCPIAYLGDDTTDEDAFIALGKKGLKVLVNTESKHTNADIRLIPPEELLAFLDLWLAAEDK